MIYCG
jgi:MFS family permease